MNYSTICIQCVTATTENSGAITMFNNQQLEQKDSLRINQVHLRIVSAFCSSLKMKFVSFSFHLLPEHRRKCL